MEKVSVTCRLSAEAVAFLDELGKSADRDRSYLIKEAVDKFIAQQRWQVEEVERASAEVRQGKVLTEEEFDADMKTWGS
jgi:RHH-type transcriptional regulator, rel operon repressor / antitoxin RelB